MPGYKNKVFGVGPSQLTGCLDTTWKSRQRVSLKGQVKAVGLRIIPSDVGDPRLIGSGKLKVLLQQFWRHRQLEAQIGGCFELP